MAIQSTSNTPIGKQLVTGLVAWIVAILIFFPIIWMVMASFKTEVDAIATPPLFVYTPTLENYVAVNAQADYFKFVMNSVVIALASTIFCLLLAVPCAFAMSFYPTNRTRSTLLWMLSTKMLPPVGVLVPIYLIGKQLGLLDSRTLLIILYTLMNLPIAVWMLYTFFKEVPKDIIEASRIDGATTRQVILVVLLPLVMPGIASTGLLCIILSWNEAFWSLNLSASNAAPLPAFIASFSAPQGLFWAKLSAASTLAIAPILIIGWLSQRQLVRGLTFGAVK